MYAIQTTSFFSFKIPRYAKLPIYVKITDKSVNAGKKNSSLPPKSFETWYVNKNLSE